MAVKAEFQADFASFYAGVDKAVAKTGEFERSAKKADAATKQWSTAFGAADSVLQQAGVSVGGAGRALDEMTNAAGKSVSQLGLVASGALVVGTAMAAWNFGRAIAGWLGLDKAIADATATMMGWGSVSAETAGAKQDTINKALSMGAAAGIQYGEAIAFIAKKDKERLTGIKESNKANADTLEVMKELNSAGATYQETIAGIDGATVEAVKHYLEAGVSQGALATAYGLTAVQVKAVAESLKAAEAADKAWLEQMKASAAEAELYADVLARLVKDGIDKTTTADERATAALTRKTDAITESILAEDKARATLAASVQGTDALTSAWMTMQQSLADLEKQKVGDIDTTARQQVIWNDYTKAVETATAAQQNAPAAIDATAAAHDRATKSAGVYMNQLHMLVDDPKLASFFGGNAAAVGFYGGGHGGFTPEEAAAMGAGQFINFAGSSMATGRVMGAQITFNIHQPLGTPDAIARAVGDAMTTRSRAVGARL